MHARMVEQIAETDDALTLKYLDGEEISVDELRAALRRATIAGKATPVLCGSSLRNKGVQPMLDAVVDYLPSPLDIPPVARHQPGTDEEVAAPGRPTTSRWRRWCSRSSPTPTWAGWPTSGSTRARSPRARRVYNSTKGKRERIGRLIRMYADRREDIDEVLAGDIAAVLG